MEVHLGVGDARIHLLGTVQGFVPDAARVQAALSEGAVDCVALGIPPEDLAGIATLAEVEDPRTLIGRPTPMEEGAGSPGVEDLLRPHQNIPRPRPKEDDGKPFVDLDETQERFLALVGRFGATRIPSPDLQVAYHWAKANDRRLEALDMDDEAHAETYIQHNKFRHVLRSGRILKRLMRQSFDDAADAHDLALQWDTFQNALPSLQAVEVAREAFMADRLRDLAKAYRSIVAVVPAARMAGVVSRLQSTPS